MQSTILVAPYWPTTYLSLTTIERLASRSRTLNCYYVWCNLIITSWPMAGPDIPLIKTRPRTSSLNQSPFLFRLTKTWARRCSMWRTSGGNQATSSHRQIRTRLWDESGDSSSQTVSPHWQTLTSGGGKRLPYDLKTSLHSSTFLKKLMLS